MDSFSGPTVKDIFEAFFSSSPGQLIMHFFALSIGIFTASRILAVMRNMFDSGSSSSSSSSFDDDEEFFLRLSPPLDVKWCPSCGALLRLRTTTCSCGYRFLPQKVLIDGSAATGATQALATGDLEPLRKCRDCQSLVPADSVFCIDCGAQLP